MANPYVLLALVLAWGASCGLAYYKGGEHREAAIIAAAAKDASDAQARADAAAAENERRKAERAERDRTRDEEVNTYVTTDDARAACFDAAGFELFNGAGSAVPVPGGGSSSVPPPAAEGAGEHARRRAPGSPR